MPPLRIGLIGCGHMGRVVHLNILRRLPQVEVVALAVRSVFTTPPGRMPEWRQRRASGGGALLDLASHHVDLVRFWFNQQVVEVRGSVRSERAEADTATLELRLANGLQVQSFFSMS